LGVVARISRPVRRLTMLAPLSLLIGFFVFPLIFFVQQLRIMWGIWHAWSEVAELSLYAGLVLSVVLFERWTTLRQHLPKQLK